MPFPVSKYSVVVNGRPTSVSLEPPFLRLLKRLANESGVTLEELVSTIALEAQLGNSLSSSLRLYVAKKLTDDLVNLGREGLAEIWATQEPRRRYTRRSKPRTPRPDWIGANART